MNCQFFFDEMIGWKGIIIRSDVNNSNINIEEDGLSLFSLGYMSEMGYGREKSDAEALEYYKQAAEKGSVPALFTLGLKFEYGKGVERSIPNAIKYYRKAADLGHGIAQQKALKLGIVSAEAAENEPIRQINSSNHQKQQKKLAVGDSIRFGRYYQNSMETPEEIEWLVLAVENGKSLLLSKKGLDAVYYHSSVGSLFNKITWEKSDIRTWLNVTFYDNAFSNAEKARIQEVVNHNPDNPLFKTKGGNDTRDKIFLLSIDEVRKYLPTNSDRQCQATYIAKQNGAYVAENGNSWWWLRSPGGSSRYAATVDNTGNVFTNGSYVSNGNDVVRPALWLNL